MAEPITIVVIVGSWAASKYIGPLVSKWIKEKLDIPEDSYKGKVIEVIVHAGVGIATGAIIAGVVIPAGIRVFGVGPEGIRKATLFALAQAKGYILTKGCVLSRIQAVGMSPLNVPYMMAALGGGLANARISFKSKL